MYPVGAWGIGSSTRISLEKLSVSRRRMGYWPLDSWKMNTSKSFKTELDPNNKQRAFFRQCAGVSRFVFNWALNEWEVWFFESGVRPVSANRLKKFWNCMVKRDECAWVYDYPYAIQEAAFRNLGQAFSNFYRQRKDGTVAKRIAQQKANGVWGRRVAKLLEKGRSGIQLEPGYPRYKSKHDASISFQLRDVKIYPDCVDIPGIGLVKLKERNYLPIDANKPSTYYTISRHAGRWFISMTDNAVETRPVETTGKVIGVDFGIKNLVVCSNGKVFENPRHLKNAEQKIKRLQRELDRRVKGGANWRKTKAKLQRAHFDLANARSHTLHEISSYLTYQLRPSVIVLEDLNVSGMMKNHRLAQAIGDVGWGELRRQVEYKSEWVGSEVVLADRWEPSSKKCSLCGAIKHDLTLADREYHCDNCGGVIDRDWNASRNLAALVSRQTGDACLGS